MEKIQAFLRRKNIVISARRYGIDALGAMAQGLFCSLLIGTILNTVGTQFHIGFLTVQLITINGVGYTIGGLASFMSGSAMAVAIGYALQAPPLVLFSLVTVGYACNALGGAGGPLAVLFVAIIAAEVGKAVSKETKVDILVTPIVTILVGVGAAWVIAPPIGGAASAFGQLIMRTTELQPFWMGMLVSVLVGIALTLPISSAAICSVLGLTGLAGGAAVAGCCANMVGFAVLSFRENRWGGLVSQGIGTSMLQMPNIVKNPRIWLPAILTSAVTGPLATCFFKLEMNGDPINAGMGTCGLCGQLGIWTGWVAPSEAALANGAAAIAPTAFDWAGLVLISFVLPAVLTWAFGLFFRRIGWIQRGRPDAAPVSKIPGPRCGPGIFRFCSFVQAKEQETAGEEQGAVPHNGQFHHQIIPAPQKRVHGIPQQGHHRPQHVVGQEQQLPGQPTSAAATWSCKRMSPHREMAAGRNTPAAVYTKSAPVIP